MSIHGVRMNIKGVKETLRAPGVRKELMRRMERAAAQANANAPVGETGNLSRSHEAYMDDRPDSQLPAARVRSDRDYALVVESRTGYLSAALDAASGRDA